MLQKVQEEIAELGAVSGDRAHAHAELGDLLFAVVNVARHLQVDAEHALRDGNEKFAQRFRFIEARLAEQKRRPQDCTLAELDALWDEAKRQE